MIDERQINWSLLRSVLVIVLLAVTVCTGCARRSRGQGAGEDVDVCQGFRELQAFAEPRADRGSDLDAYGQAMVRVLDRMQPEVPIRRTNAAPVVPPQQVITDMRLMRQEIESFRLTVAAAKDDGTAVRRAVDAFARNDTYNDADAHLSAFAGETCPA